ncbi:MAG: ABC transporter permease [Acetobacteraceae bacterium]
MSTRAAYAGLLVPLSLLFLFFLVAPFLNIVVMSFYTYSPIKIWVPHLTTANYLGLAQGGFGSVLLRTMRIGLICTLVCAFFGYPVAYFLARTRPAVRAVCLFLLLMPLMVSSVIRTYGWLVILGREGLVNNFLHALGFARISLLYNEAAVIVGLANVFMPFMTLPLMASIERINPRLEEAARNLGANWAGTFRRVILPLSGPGLISGCLLVYSAAISAFVVPALMGGARVQVLGRRIYDQLLVSYQWPLASAIATLLVIGTGLLIAIALIVTRRGPTERARA